MSDRIFVDTNVLVYAFDDGEPTKKQRALEVLAAAGEHGRAVISTQVLQEFYATVTRKLERPLPAVQAEAALGKLAILPTVLIDTHLVLAAVRFSRRHRVSIWDALIVQAAVEGACDTLLTEDLQAGWRVDGLEVRDPFAG